MLQAYLHHMPHSVQCSASDKLKELLHCISEVSRLHKLIGVGTDSASEPGPDVRMLKTVSFSLIQIH